MSSRTLELFFTTILLVVLVAFSLIFISNLTFAQEVDVTNDGVQLAEPLIEESQAVESVVEETSDVVEANNATLDEETILVEEETATTEESVTADETLVTDSETTDSNTTTDDLPVIDTFTVTAPVSESAGPDLSTGALAQAELTTDKADYFPGETATILGKFFQSLQNIVLKIFGSDENDANYTETVVDITADESGEFSADYTLDDLYRPFYEVYAFDLTGNELASTWFRDAAIGTYDQCSNDLGLGYGSGDTGCRWINGNLNGNNSTYQEGDSTVQRLWLEGLTPGSHSVTFQYGTTKAGTHAYDFLTTWNASEPWITEPDQCQDITNCVGTPQVNASIPDDANAQGLDTAFGDRSMTMRGGTLGAITVPSLVSGTYGGGDSETAITVNFTVPASGPMCSTKKVQGQNVTSCAIAIWFGAHIAKTSEWTPKDGFGGAGNIPGSPYHVALAAMDGASVGQRDNQMQASAIISPSTITIHKVTSPLSDTTTSFAFTTTGTGYAGFSLTGGTSNAQSVAPGSYSVTETSPLPTYANTALSCTASGTGSSATPTLGTRSVAITIGSAGGATIDCIYTNTLQQGSIELKKVWSGTAGQTTLNIGTSAGGAQVDTQLTGAAGAAPLTTGANNVNAGTYYMSEAGGLTGYSTSLTCTDNGSPTSVGLNDSVSVVAGHTVVCTYTNTRQTGKIELQKDFVGTPENVTIKIGTTQNGSGIDSDVLSADGTDGEHTVDTGTYFVSEVLTTPTNYTSGLACSNDNNHNNIVDGGDTSHTVNTSTGELSVGNNDDVICVYTNTRNQGTIELKKHWVGTPGSTTIKIGSTIGGMEVDSQAVSGSDNTTGQNTVNTGTYYASETGGLTDYTSSALSCFNDANNNGTNDSETAVTVGASDAVAVTTGQHVICTYTNTRNQGKIELQKDFVGTPENVTIKIGTLQNGSQTDSQALSADGTTGENTVNTGTFFVSEVLTTPANYTSSLACYNDVNDNDAVDGGDTVHSVNTGTGEVAVGNNNDVLCVYTNTRKTGTVELQKVWSGTGGQTTLQIGTTAGDDDVGTQLTGAAGAAPLTTGQNTVDTGTFYVSETGGLTNYDSSLSCFNDINNNGANDSELAVVPGGSNSVTVGSGDHVICTYTNTRQQGSIELVKDWVGTPSSVDLAIGTSQGGSQVDSELNLTTDGATGANTVDTDTYYVSETVTNASNYDTSLNCVNGQDPVAVGQDSSVAVGDDNVVVCTFTNTRKTGTVELQKVWSGTGGQTTLQIGTTAGDSDIGSQLTGAAGVAPLTTGQKTVDAPATIYMSETGGLTDYDQSALSCFNDADNDGIDNDASPVSVGANDSVTVTADQHVICSYTNTRQTGKIELQKDFVGGDENVTIKIGTAQNGLQVDTDVLSADGTDGEHTVDTGNYFVSEVLTIPANYTSSLTCYNDVNDDDAVDGGDTAHTVNTSTGEVSVGNGDDVLCVYTNTKKATLTIVKDAQPNDCQDFTFSRSYGANFVLDDDAGVQDCVDTNQPQSVTHTNIVPGAVTVTETLPNQYWQLDSASCVVTNTQDAYQSSLNGTVLSLTLTPGANVTCTFQNDKLAPTRTQGFWQTHLTYTTGVFNTFVGLMVIGNGATNQDPINTIDKLFGAFHSNIAKKTTGQQRTALDKARMQLAQQLAAAKLNCKAFGCTAGVQAMITAADTAYAGTSVSAILTSAGQMDAYNNSGDTIIVGPTGKADPKGAKAITNYVFWDTP